MGFYPRGKYQIDVTSTFFTYDLEKMKEGEECHQQHALTTSFIVIGVLSEIVVDLDGQRNEPGQGPQIDETKEHGIVCGFTVGKGAGAQLVSITRLGG